MAKVRVELVPSGTWTYVGDAHLSPLEKAISERLLEPDPWTIEVIVKSRTGKALHYTLIEDED